MAEPRRLVRAGQSSHTVSLPKDWLLRNNLKAGDVVYVEVKSERELILSPERKPVQDAHREITISIDGRDKGTVQRLLTSAYVNNYRTIRFVGAVDKRLPEIRGMMESFSALEITEQSPKTIIVSDLLNLAEIDLDKTVRRMDMMVRTMLEECASSEMAESLRIKDEEVNKLYFLAIRLLKSSLTSIAAREQLNVSLTDILSYWEITLALENLADDAKTVHTLVAVLGKERAKLAKDLLKLAKDQYVSAMKAWYDKNKDLADIVAKSRIGLLDACAAFGNKRRDAASAEFVEHCKAIVLGVITISRVVIDRSEEDKAVVSAKTLAGSPTL